MRPRPGSSLRGMGIATLVGLAVALAGLAVAAPPTPAAAPPPSPPAPPAPVPPAAKPGLYLGLGSCGRSVCHGSTVPRHEYDVLQNEFQIWKDDPHATAFESLTNAQSAAIARNLHLPSPADSPLCLGCHALAVPKAQQAGRVEVEDGVSCESCHGPASGWLEGHRAAGWTHADSVKAGMTDLRDLDTRGRLCLSCHLGSAGQTVDHDLLAAGHPLLLFELDNSTEGLPRHWMPWRDKRDKGRAGADTHGARAWAVGQAVAFRAGLTELARQARGERWPEFSALDCNVCHHPLAEARYRTARSAERPGLPRWSPARWAVLRHLVEAYAPAERAGLDADVDLLARQLAHLATPPAQVAETAERAARRAGAVIAAVDRRWDAGEARRLLLALSADRERLSSADVRTAEQAYFAVHTLLGELLAGRLAPQAAAALAAADEALNRELADRESYSGARFAERLAELERQVRALP